MVEEAVQFMRENIQQEDYRETFEGFKPHEVLKLERNLAIMKEGKPVVTLDTNKLQFYQFVNEYDKRRGTTFVKVFPEMEDYYNECKLLQMRTKDAKETQ